MTLQQRGGVTIERDPVEPDLLDERVLGSDELPPRRRRMFDQIQWSEATDYAGVSVARLVEIAEALDLTIHYDVRLTQAN